MRSKQWWDRLLATIIECLVSNVSLMLMSTSAVPTVSTRSPFAATIFLLPYLLILTLLAMLSSASRIRLIAAPVPTSNFKLRPLPSLIALQPTSYSRLILLLSGTGDSDHYFRSSSRLLQPVVGKDDSPSGFAAVLDGPTELAFCETHSPAFQCLAGNPH
ncbi:WD repeat-containing protein [Trichinella spiralis]|uniref:WD repeat-containing protein n=1 Tax=Trichinella spiralis TaxID=6334 RepID=A0ABR3KF48_TRISP